MDRLRRSNKPIFWSLFGAGGMLSALMGPALVFVVGIGVPLGLFNLSYDRVLSFAQHPLGKAAIFLVISLFLFHGCHRLYHCVHDFGIHVGPGIKAAFHGLAFLATLVAAALLVTI